MSKTRELKRQSVFSVRITNNVDDGFLAWLNQTHERGWLQRQAIEGLYLQYAQQMSLPGQWVPTPTKALMDMPREALGYMALFQESTEALESNTEVQEVSPNDDTDTQSNELSAETKDNLMANPALESAFDFLDDD